MRRTAAATLAALGLACAEAPPRPDVLLYVVDTLRADSLGCTGDPQARTPRIDAFARDALLVEQAFAPSSWTRSSMASLWTATLPSRHGVDGRHDHLPGSLPTLAETLREAGYRTAYLTTNPNAGAFFGFGRGFQSVIELYDRVDSHAAIARREPVASSDDLTARAIEWLEGVEGPFFLAILSIDPHWPYASAPGRLPKKAYRRFYRQEIARNDRSFGALLDHLGARGRLDATLVVFTADHGEEFFEHGHFGHGRTLYDEVLRVPLLVRPPASAGLAAGRVARAVTLLDVFPTILDALDLPAPPGLEGRSVLAPGDAAGAPTPLVASLRLDGRALRASREPRFKLVVDEASGEERLFDLDAEPGEEEPVAAPVNGEAARARERLRAALARDASRSPESQLRPLEEIPEHVEAALEALGYAR